MQKLISIAALLMFAIACGSPTEPTSGPRCNSRITGGTFSAVIDGVTWSTASPTGSFLCGFNNALTIHSSTAPSPYYSFKIDLSILGSLEPGVYPVGFGFPHAHASLDRNDGTGFRVWLTGGLTSSGAATLSVATKERAAGSFEFTLAPGALVSLPEDMRPISVTNGTFDVRF